MEDISDVIFRKYNIDIKRTNVLKLYKIDNQNISPEDLANKITDCRKKWQQSINGANEKFAERDRVHLEKADSYEKILRDKKLRKDLFAYYNKSNGDDVVVAFAREYFKLVNSTTKIHNKEVEFFFTYFPEQRKNGNLIQEMLKAEYKVMTFGKDAGVSEEVVEIEGKKKGSSLLISNLFQQATVINLRKCETLFEKAGKSNDVCSRFPELRTSMYELLGVAKFENFADFKTHVEKMRNETASLKYDRGQDYAPLVDFYNNLSRILEFNDVIDNFSEFKLLIQYPKLTPYMYLFENMKQGTLNNFYTLASQTYGFRDFTDFILTYFLPIYDNFGIYDHSIKGVLKKAEKKAGQKKILDKIDKAFGLSKEKKMPFVVKLVHVLTYWPIYILFGLFEVTKFVVDNMRYISLAGFIPMLMFMLTKASNLYGVKFSAIRTIVSKELWYAFLDDFIGIRTQMTFEVIFVSIEAIILLFVLFILPPIMGTVFLWTSASHLTKRYDWKGIERTLKMILQSSESRTKNKYADIKGKLFTKLLPNIILNFICVAIVVLLIIFVPKGIQ